MNRFALSIAASVVAFAPLATHAEPFTTAHDITIPVSVSKPQNAAAVLSPELRQNVTHTNHRVINAENMAVPSTIQTRDEDLIPRATFVTAPAAAETVPVTSVDLLRDGNVSTSFQPASQRSFTFLLQFNEDVAPSRLEYVMQSGSVDSVRVRIGKTASTLRNAFVGTPRSNRLDLSGERGRMVEITFTMHEGVPRIGALYLLQPRTELLFRAVPNQTYRLLYGSPVTVEGPYDARLTNWEAVQATLGAARKTTGGEQDDHDGRGEGDNCPQLWNLSQEDHDKDGAGDVCDICPAYADPLQTDTDGDGTGDACEDDDKDRVQNAVDNCPVVSNPSQQDEDQDGVGNVCDNVDNRFTAGKPWLLWAGLTLVVLMLGGAGAMILRRTKPDGR